MGRDGILGVGINVTRKGEESGESSKFLRIEHMLIGGIAGMGKGNVKDRAVVLVSVGDKGFGEEHTKGRVKRRTGRFEIVEETKHL